MTGLRISDEYTRRGADVVFLENNHLRIEVLAGNGGDITEIRDKRTDVNLLFEAPHRWRTPAEGYAATPNGMEPYMDYYPGGWQDVLPGAGADSTASGAGYGLHGETTTIPWEYEIEDHDSMVAATLSVELTRYPFTVERRLELEEGASSFRIDETVTNESGQELDYSWLQHIAFGQPLVGPDATLEVPCDSVLVGSTETPADYPAETVSEWPFCELDGEQVDLREFPHPDEAVNNQVELTDFTEPRYTIRNPALDLGVTVGFSEDPFEYLWYWRNFGSSTGSPLFGRQYIAGLEPCTSVNSEGLDEQISNGSANVLGPHETVEGSVTVETHRA